MERRFVGRCEELEKLGRLRKKKSASFVVIRGRRRVGKSRLIREFGRHVPAHIISGLPPTSATTKQSQLSTFVSQVSTSFGVPNIQVRDWGEAFFYLSSQCQNGQIVIALDEISWIGSKDADFLGHLKNAWDLYLSNNPRLILIICGSVSSWIEANILKSTGFMGRISLDIKLEELSVSESAEFWDGKQARLASHEVLQLLAVTGGVPKYLEEIDPTQSSEENIRRLCFDREGLLFREFDQIFPQLFSAKSTDFATLVINLATGKQTLSSLAEAVGRAESTTLGYLYDLIQAGFVSEDPTWALKTGRCSRFKHYRLSDNYLRFYFRYIAPKKTVIEKRLWKPKTLVGLPDWNAVMGLQFENLVMNNMPSLLSALNIDRSDVLMSGPFFQKSTQRRKGCQIDLLIQTRFRSFYLVEVKYSVDAIGLKVMNEVEEKDRRISWPRGWSRRLVLIHVNGVTSDLEQTQFFDHLIDFGAITL